MTDIVEQAARVIYDTENYNRAVLEDAQVITQALADAGLLAQPARTVPTREEIADRLHKTFLGVTTDDSSRKEIADHILELLANQPTVAEVKAQALEEFAEVWATGEWSDWFLAENVTCDVSAVQATDKVLRERAQEIREEQ